MTNAAATAATIRQHNPALADCYIRQPFRRVDLAQAFAAGFSVDQFGELPAVCWVVIRAAIADREARRAMVGR